MSAASPFDEEFVPGGLEDELDPELRSPAFRQPGSDLESTPLKMEEPQILQLLSQYFDEAENARETGFEPRHEVWEQNLHSFWMRRSFDDKMEWQAKEVSSQVPNFVERFAATQRQSLTQTPDWVRVEDPNDEDGTMSRFKTKLTRKALDFAGTNASGQPVEFEHIFGNICQTGALMKMAAAVTFDPKTGRVVAEQVDPRQCYWDPTGRGLYRVRFWEVDKETLLRQAELVDAQGRPIYDAEAIEELVAHHERRITEDREESSGQGQMLHSPRTPILLKEWLVDLIDDSGSTEDKRTVREKQLIVVGNDQRIIRGPEPNPWWHGKDWIVGHPVLQAPMSPVDGRTYVELFRHSVETHENVMNRILDTASTNMNAFEVDPDALEDPEQIEFGIGPNQTILRSEDANPGEQAIRVIEMGGRISPDMMTLWQSTKTDAQEAAAQSDISLGQTVPHSGTTATEVAASERGQSALNSSISMDIDLGFLGPLAELVYWTAVQHVSRDTPMIWNSLTPEEQAMLQTSKQEFRSRPVTVKASGLTKAVERSKRTRGLLGALNVIGGNQVLAQQFMSTYSMPKLLNLLLEDMGVPIDRIEKTQAEKQQQMQADATAATQQQMLEMFGGGAGAGAGPGGPLQTSQNQGGTDPAAPGVPEGLSGEVGR
jgi:hypothetical protein